MNYFPLSYPILLALVFLVAFVFILIQVGVLQYTYERLVGQRHFPAQLPDPKGLAPLVNQMEG